MKISVIFTLSYSLKVLTLLSEENKNMVDEYISDDDSFDTLLKEALQDFEECRLHLNRSPKRKLPSVDVSTSTPAIH